MKDLNEKWQGEIDEFYQSVKSASFKCWREIKRTMKKIFDWYLFYRPTSKVDRALHIIEWFCATAVILRVLVII